MTEHTKGLHITGPCEQRIDYTPIVHYAGDYAILDANNKIVGEAYHRVGKTDHYPAEANARLWASAPDLLAACEALKRAVQHKDIRIQQRGREINGTGWAVVEACQMIDAAIRKARGEEAGNDACNATLLAKGGAS